MITFEEVEHPSIYDIFIKIGDTNFITMSKLRFIFFSQRFPFQNSHTLRIHICYVPCVVYMLIFLSYAFKDTLKNKSIEASRNF